MKPWANFEGVDFTRGETENLAKFRTYPGWEEAKKVLNGMRSGAVTDVMKGKDPTAERIAFQRGYFQALEDLEAAIETEIPAAHLARVEAEEQNPSEEQTNG